MFILPRITLHMKDTHDSDKLYRTKHMLSMLSYVISFNSGLSSDIYGGVVMNVMCKKIIPSWVSLVLFFQIFSLFAGQTFAADFQQINWIIGYF